MNVIGREGSVALDSADIITICTGNICRSPVAERLLASGLADGFRVTSAGVTALIDEPMHPVMASKLRLAGDNSDGFSSRQVSVQMLRQADLVLCMTRAQRGEVVRTAPFVLRRTFTLRELARILGSPSLPSVGDEAGAGRLRALVELSSRHRSLELADEGDDDIPDPYGRDEAAYESAYQQIHHATAKVIHAFVGR